MNKPIQAKKSPDVKPWVRRVVEALGVFLPDNEDGERRLGWWGVEMARFLNFCKTLPAETALRPAMEGYGRYIKSSVPPLQDWQIEQTREALRCFQKGTENWHVAPPDSEGRVEVSFRVKTRGAEGAGPQRDSGAKSGGSEVAHQYSGQGTEQNRGQGSSFDIFAPSFGYMRLAVTV